jgi:uncharacterized phage protein gp47/JayE
MATFTRPTLSELLTRIAGDIASRTEGRAFIRRTVERCMGFAMAGVAHHLHGHLAWLRLQLYPQTAAAEGLAEWADLLEEPRKAGAYASGQVAVIGDGSLTSGTLFTDDAGNLYRSGEPVGSGTYAIAAVETGSAQNLSLGERLTLVSSVAGLQPQASVSSALSGGADTEDIELWRPRVIAAFRAPSLYGAPGDYRRWALRREGVTEAWELDRRMGPGTVALSFIFGGRSDPIPTGDDVAAMQAYIDSVRPADVARVYVQAPVPNALRLAVTARGTMTEEAMAAAARDFLAQSAALEQPLSISQLEEVLSQVQGELSHTITSIEVVIGGVAHSVPLTGEIAASAWGLFTLDALTLTVVS